MSRKIVTGKRAKADEHDTLVDSNAESVPKLAAPTALSLPRPSPFEYCEVDAIEADLMCPVCLAPLFEPVTHVPCGRMFCACCLSSCAACPLCRRPLDGVDSTQVVKTRYILQKLDEIPVRCPVCRQSFQRAVLGSHLPSCPVPCARACGISIAPKNLEHHLNAGCPSVEVGCPNADVGCSWKDKRSLVDAHHVTCAFTPLRSALLVYQQHILEHKQMISLQQTTISELKADNLLLAEIVRHLLLQHHPLNNLYLDTEADLLKEGQKDRWSTNEVKVQRAADLALLKARILKPSAQNDAGKK